MEEQKEGQSNHIQQNVVQMSQESSIHKTQKTLEDKTDWISRLPDSLLLQILSHLEVEDVVKSSLLSKRWRYLWRSIAYLDFGSLDRETVSKQATFIDRCLFLHDRSKVCKLFINMKYEEEYVLLIDSWISFALRCKTEEFKLDLFDGNLPENKISEVTLYKLPHCLFRFGSLKYLKLCGCDLNVPTKIEFNSLKELCFEDVDLDPCVIDHITSSSPLLEHLSLIDCNRAIDLDIWITNENVKILEIREYGDYELLQNDIITIHAPNVISLEFFHSLPRTKYHVKNLQSLMLASFSNVDEDDMEGELKDEETRFGLTTLLHDLRHAKELRLSDWCIQALSVMEMRKLDPVVIDAQCVKVCFAVTKWELPGIAYLLRSACNLETLKISICDYAIYKRDNEFLEEFYLDDKGYWKQRELDLSSTLLNTKTIMIQGFQCCDHFWRGKQCLENEMEFVQFLLKNSKVLEKMEIEMNKETQKDVELMFMLRQTLTDKRSLNKRRQSKAVEARLMEISSSSSPKSMSAMIQNEVILEILSWATTNSLIPIRWPRK